MNSLFSLYSNAGDYNNEYPDMFGRSRFYNAGNSDILTPGISNTLFAEGFRPTYPDGKKFAVCISHDVDHLFLNHRKQRKLVNGAKEILKGKLESGAIHFKSLIKENISRDYDLKKLIDINNGYKVRSTYYFLSLLPGEEDFNYRLSDIEDQWQAVLRAGNEIGLHGGHKAFNNSDKLGKEKKLMEDSIGKKVEGYRNHFLKFEIPTTWNNLQDIGFLYDSTLGYADCIGFRNGMCYPYYPFDIRRNQFLDLIELPLAIMDATLFYYMRLDSDIAFKICKNIIDQVKKCQGVFTLLWHNNFMTGEMKAVYLRLLDYLQQDDPWYATSAELITWWKEEGLMKQSQEMIKELIINSQEK